MKRFVFTFFKASNVLHFLMLTGRFHMVAFKNICYCMSHCVCGMVSSGLAMGILLDDKKQVPFSIEGQSHVGLYLCIDQNLVL